MCRCLGRGENPKIIVDNTYPLNSAEHLVNICLKSYLSYLGMGREVVLVKGVVLAQFTELHEGFC